ncbi:MAG: helix-turn-helix domain-containing protein [Gemmatimonadales bacterium]
MRGSSRSYRGGLIEHAIMPPHEPDGFTSTSRSGSIGVSFTGHRGAIRQYVRGPIVEADIPPGASFVTSSSDLRWLEVREPSESLEVYPRPGLVRAVAAELDGSASAGLPDVAGVEDPVVWSVAATFRAALLGGRPMTELEADTRLRLLLRHVLITYGGLAGNRPVRGRLDARRLSRVTEFIEARLEGRLLLAELAQVAALSPFHFLRAFRRTTGLTPHAYVTARRMERALRLLSSTERPIPEIAARLGYANPVNFRRAFRKAFGVVPGGIARR